MPSARRGERSRCPTFPAACRVRLTSKKHTISTAASALAVVGAILLATSFLVRNPVPLTVRGAIVLFMAAGLAVTFRFLRVKNQQDFYGGMALILLALVAFVASNDLPGMRGFAFGPGTAPRLFAFTLWLC